MAKITFIGAGSTVFAKNVLGDVLLTPAFSDGQIVLFDIDKKRLDESYQMLYNIKENYHCSTSITVCHDRKEALRDADYVINAAQIGGFEPCGVRDLELPRDKYGLRQTVGDTLGIGGIFRALRTIPVLVDILHEMQEVCPKAWFVNYVNPMAIVTGALLKEGGIKTIGICHSVQECIPELFGALGIPDENVVYKIAGINHMAWLLEVTRDGEDLYPLIKKLALEKTEKHNDMVRFEFMRRFGYYVTESSRHTAEYMPYWIKSAYPELIERFNIPLDAYITNSRRRMGKWEEMRANLVDNPGLSHTRTKEYASRIIEALETGVPYTFNGNVKNTGLITNLPSEAVVEVPCLVDRTGISPCYVGALPEHLAALNRTNINVQLLTIQAAFSHKKEDVYYAAMLDPHTSAELSIDDIVSMCDDLFEAHGSWLPEFH